MVLFNDWSARDIRGNTSPGTFPPEELWFLNFPVVVTLEALDHLRVSGPQQDPEVLDYLKYEGDGHYDIPLEVEIILTELLQAKLLPVQLPYMYWNMRQQQAHHTVNGCNSRRRHDGQWNDQRPRKGLFRLHARNLLAWYRPVAMPDGTERKFIQDGDTVVMRAPYFGKGQQQDYRLE